MFSAGPFTNEAAVGSYNVSITAVTLNGVSYSTIINTIASPNSFILTVSSSPCSSTIVSPSLVPAITVAVSQGTSASLYGQLVNFTDSVSKAAGDPSLC